MVFSMAYVDIVMGLTNDNKAGHPLHATLLEFIHNV
jgi:hypothetical protein